MKFEVNDSFTSTKLTHASSINKENYCPTQSEMVSQIPNILYQQNLVPCIQKYRITNKNDKVIIDGSIYILQLDSSMMKQQYFSCWISFS